MTPEARQRRREKRQLKLAERQAVIDALRTAGKLCSNCRDYQRAPIGLHGRICALQSDSDGYVIVQPTHVCPSHSSTVGAGK